MFVSRGSKHKCSSLIKVIAVAGLMISVTACGSLGGDSKETPPAPTATVRATQDPGASPTVESNASTAVPLTTAESSPAYIASPAASPAATDPSATPLNETLVTSIIEVVVSAVAVPGTPVVVSTPALSTPVAAGTPSAALTVTSCEPNDVPQFTGNGAEYVVKEDLNFRVGPGSDCDAIGNLLVAGTQVTVISDPVVREGDTTQWVQVSIDGEIGWVSLEYISPA